jgi:hypothetical protein
MIVCLLIFMFPFSTIVADLHANAQSTVFNSSAIWDDGDDKSGGCYKDYDNELGVQYPGLTDSYQNISSLHSIEDSFHTNTKVLPPYVSRASPC